MSIKIALFGLPASGKGTLSANITRDWGCSQLSTGDMIRRLRQEPGPIGDELRALPVGSFASDDLVVKAVLEELKLPKYELGVIFDGFPRTLAQWESLQNEGVKLDAAVYLIASQELLIDRAVNRRVHLDSGRVYNLKSMPPKVDGIDDVTGEPLFWREDDKQGVIQRRFADYWGKTHPVVESIKRNPQVGCHYLEVDAMSGEQAVWSSVSETLSQKRSFPSARKPKSP